MLTRAEQFDLMTAVSIAMTDATAMRKSARESMKGAFLSGRLISPELFLGSLTRAHAAHVEAEDWLRLFERLYTLRTSEGLARP